MVREPALEILHYLRTADYTRPAVRYVICILFVLWEFYFKSLSSIKSRMEYYIHCGMWKVSKDILCDPASLCGLDVQFCRYRSALAKVN